MPVRNRLKKTPEAGCYEKNRIFKESIIYRPCCRYCGRDFICKFSWQSLYWTGWNFLFLLPGSSGFRQLGFLESVSLPLCAEADSSGGSVFSFFYPLEKSGIVSVLLLVLLFSGNLLGVLYCPLWNKGNSPVYV